MEAKKNMLTLGQNFDQKAKNIKSRVIGKTCINFLTMMPSAVCVWYKNFILLFAPHVTVRFLVPLLDCFLVPICFLGSCLRRN